MACEGGIACVGTGGCIEAMPDGALGQVLTWGAAGPSWAASADDQTAAEVPLTATGDIAATNVQDALAELDTEKLSEEDLCTSPDSGTAQPGNILVLRDPGTGCQVEQWLPFFDILNPGAALPIADPASNTVGDFFVNGGVYFGESNDMIPRRGADGAIYFVKRLIYARGGQNTAQGISPNTTVIVNFDRVDQDSNSAVTPGANWIFTVPAAGIYTTDFGAALVAANLTGPTPGSDVRQALIGFLYVNGAVVARLGVDKVQVDYRDNLQVYGSHTRLYSAGDTISFSLYLFDSTNTLPATNTLTSISETYFSITRG